MTHQSPNFLTCPIEPPEPPVQPTGEIEHKTEEKKPEEPKPRKWKRLIFILAGVVLLILILPPGIVVVRGGLAVLNAKNAVNRAQDKLRQLDVAGAQADLSQASAALGDTRDVLRGSGILRDAPGLGTQVRAVEDAADAGARTIDGTLDILSVAAVISDALQSGTEAAGQLSTGIAPTRSFSQLSKEEKRELLQKFYNELPRMRLARDKMDLALELWNRVPQDQLAGPLRKALQPLAETIPVLQRALNEVVPLAEMVVPMAGFPHPQRYLMSLQNADEIRPSGGFIGTIGTMTWDAGEMSEFAFTDIYNIDNPVSGVWKETPPEPIKKYLGLNLWFLRDANWSPDFPQSAERILDFFIRESEMQLHAELPHRPATYLALEPGLFKSLLQLTGPITVESETYDANNFFEKLEYKVEVDWHQQGIPVDKRKEIISKIGEELVKKLFALPAKDWPKILDVVTRALERKQIMAYSRDPEMQKLFETRGWSARTMETRGDFLWVIDANLAALKTDGAMKKFVKYTLDTKDPLGPKATVTLMYTNTAKGFSDYRYTRYRSYTRVFVPEGSEFLSSFGAMEDDQNKLGKFVPGKVDVMKDLGKTVFGAFWAIEPSKTGTLSFTYRLPKSVAEKIQAGEYRLDWMKQPGVDNAGLTVDISLGKNIKTAAPSEEKNKWGDARYEYKTDSMNDRTFLIDL